MTSIRPGRMTLLLLVFIFTTACTAAPLPPTTSTPGGGSTAASPEASTPDPQQNGGTSAPPVAEATATEPPASGPVTLRVWLPPQFSPNPAGEAGQLLGQRLDEFALLHPGIRITVRLKEEQGAGGMVSSLAATADAVPEALPDLVLIPRLELERAVQGRLLQPFDLPLEPEWYDFARSLASVDGTVYGRPFAADALVQLYRPTVILDPPRDWTTTINTGLPLLFAGGSQNALFTLALYEAAGGQLLDAAGQVHVDRTTLAALFKFFADSARAGVFTETIAQIATASEVHDRFDSGETDLAITWVSYELPELDSSTGVTGLPTVTNVPYSLVNGWMWALTNPDPTRMALAEELADFLTTPEFLSAWTEAAGYLPPRSDALSAWPNSPETSLVSRLVLSAHPLPPLRVVEQAGPAIQQLILPVLSGEMTPAEAAAAVVGRVNVP